MKKVRAHILVSGLVQGVFFRFFTVKKAKEFGVFGWVKNLPDGKIEAIFEGEKEKVQNLVEWMKRGPPNARVDGVKIEWQKFEGKFDNFEIKFL